MFFIPQASQLMHLHVPRYGKPFPPPGANIFILSINSFESTGKLFYLTNIIWHLLLDRLPSKPWVSNIFLANGHSCFCQLVRGLHLEI